MKKILLVMLIVGAIFLSSCGGNGDPSPAQMTQTAAVNIMSTAWEQLPKSTSTVSFDAHCVNVAAYSGTPWPYPGCAGMPTVTPTPKDVYINP